MSPKARLKGKQYSVRVNGILCRKTFYSAAEARAWQRAQKDLQDRIRSGRKVHLHPTLLSVHSHEWLFSRKGMASFDHQEGYMGKYVLSRPEAKDKFLHECDVVFWKKCLHEILEIHKQGPAIHNRVRSMLHKMYEDARRYWNPPRATENPISVIDSLPEKKGPPRILSSAEEIARYIQAAYGYRWQPAWGIFVAIKLNTGLRQQNIIPLRWRDLSADGATLTVREKFVRSKSFTGFRPGHKAQGDARLVGVNSVLRTALQDWRIVTKYPGDDDFIAAATDGSHFTQKRIWDANKATCQAAKVPYLSEHKLRHSYATHYLASGGNIHDLKLNLFHASITTTEIYGHDLPAQLARRAGVFQTGEIPEPKAKKEEPAK